VLRVRREHFHRSREGGERIFQWGEREEEQIPSWWEVGENIFNGERGDHFHRSLWNGGRFFPRSWEIGRSIFQEVGREEGPFSTESREKGWNIFQGVEKEEEKFSKVLSGSRVHFPRWWKRGGAFSKEKMEKTTFSKELRRKRKHFPMC
jgi:hypothetical protein